MILLEMMLEVISRGSGWGGVRTIDHPSAAIQLHLRYAIRMSDGWEFCVRI